MDEKQMIITTITGALGKDPEVRQTAGGKVTSFSMATSVGFGESKQTIWWNISVWGDRFDKMLAHLKKGKYLTVTGSITRPPQIYKPEGGEPRVSGIDLRADILHFLPSGGEKEAPASDKPKQQTYAAAAGGGSDADYADADLPF
jgi:single-strand DNA-binding protein